jgi:hypothetical protein
MSFNTLTHQVSSFSYSFNPCNLNPSFLLFSTLMHIIFRVASSMICTAIVNRLPCVCVCVCVSLRTQIAQLKRELESVRGHRQQYRDRRASVPIPVVSLVFFLCTQNFPLDFSTNVLFMNPWISIHSFTLEVFIRHCHNNGTD